MYLAKLYENIIAKDAPSLREIIRSLNKESKIGYLNSKFPCSEIPLSDNCLLIRYNPLHFAISQKWIEGVLLLLIAGVDRNISTTILRDGIESEITIAELITIIEAPSLVEYLNSPPYAAFQDNWIIPFLDESTIRALFEKESFQAQTERALEKYDPKFDKHEWFEETFLMTYWLHTKNIPLINQTKNAWKDAHAQLRKFIYERCVTPYCTENNSTHLFQMWEEYIEFLYTPSIRLGLGEHSSFSAYWYHPSHPNCPAWLKEQWTQSLVPSYLQASSKIFQAVKKAFSPEEYSDKMLFLQSELVSLNQISEIFRLINQQSEAQFKQSIIDDICEQKNILPFSHLSKLLLNTKKESILIKFDQRLLNIFIKVFQSYKPMISDLLLNPMTPDEVKFKLEALQEACIRLNPDDRSLTPNTLFLKKPLLVKLAGCLATIPRKSKTVLEQAKSLLHVWLDQELLQSQSLQNTPNPILHSFESFRISRVELLESTDSNQPNENKKAFNLIV